jgi:hypothetical protein
MLWQVKSKLRAWVGPALEVEAKRERVRENSKASESMPKIRNSPLLRRHPMRENPFPKRHFPLSFCDVKPTLSCI